MELKYKEHLIEEFDILNRPTYMTLITSQGMKYIPLVSPAITTISIASLNEKDLINMARQYNSAEAVIADFFMQNPVKEGATITDLQAISFLGYDYLYRPLRNIDLIELPYEYILQPILARWYYTLFPERYDLEKTTVDVAGFPRGYLAGSMTGFKYKPVPVVTDMNNVSTERGLIPFTGRGSRCRLKHDLDCEPEVYQALDTWVDNLTVTPNFHINTNNSYDADPYVVEANLHGISSWLFATVGLSLDIDRSKFVAIGLSSVGDKSVDIWRICDHVLLDDKSITTKKQALDFIIKEGIKPYKRER